MRSLIKASFIMMVSVLATVSCDDTSGSGGVGGGGGGGNK